MPSAIAAAEDVAPREARSPLQRRSTRAKTCRAPPCRELAMQAPAARRRRRGRRRVRQAAQRSTNSQRSTPRTLLELCQQASLGVSCGFFLWVSRGLVSTQMGYVTCCFSWGIFAICLILILFLCSTAKGNGIRISILDEIRMESCDSTRSQSQTIRVRTLRFYLRPL